MYPDTTGVCAKQIMSRPLLFLDVEQATCLTPYYCLTHRTPIYCISGMGIFRRVIEIDREFHEIKWN
jgi:hypothetical protein